MISVMFSSSSIFSSSLIFPSRIPLSLIMSIFVCTRKLGNQFVSTRFCKNVPIVQTLETYLLVVEDARLQRERRGVVIAMRKMAGHGAGGEGGSEGELRTLEEGAAGIER
jgi:hypothetical protein